MRCIVVEVAKKRDYFSDSANFPTDYVENTFTYDDYGNLLSETNGDGDKTLHVYDTASLTLEVKTWLPPANRATNRDLRFNILTAWEPVCRLPSVVTDLNGQTTTTTYDGFCRVTRVDRPGGDFTLMTYSLGSQPNQKVRTERQAPTTTAGASIWSESFLDGLGRGYKTVSEGPSDITSETEFNQRGGIAKTSAPYYTGAAPVWTSYDYDGINRLTGIDHPGGDVSGVQYALAAATVRDILDITSTDEIGREQKFAIDAYGNLTKRTKVKVTGAVTTELVTQYQRDPLGRAVTIIDPKLNPWN